MPDPIETDRPEASRYRVLESLGEGGMGVVYKVHDTLRDRVVALKRMTPDDSVERQARARFAREFHTLAQLSHPNIVEVFDFGIDELGPFYTMELLEGSDLREAAPMPWRRACALVREVAAALALLHSRRLLHRDISPRNVYRLRNGRTKLIDFGAMSPMGFERVVTGTPPFIAPECVSRQALDGRADLFALGALAYFLLTGRHAYPARSLDQLRDAWRAQPRLPSLYANDVPEALDALVMRLLSLDALRRPASAVELVERFSTLAGLELDDLRDAIAVNAYLTTPSLIGRETELLNVRRLTLGALHARGASVWVGGVSGVGRSRLLDACALDAKLAGAAVLRVGRADAGADFATARALFEQLPGQVSEAEMEAFPHAALARCRSASDGLEQSDRSKTQAELVAFLSSLSKRRMLAIIADDVAAFDEPSLSTLASLQPAVQDRKLILICADANDARVRARAPWQTLFARSQRFELQPLNEEQVEELLRSVFGELADLKLLATRIFGLSAGLPRSCMELAQHLLDSGVILSRAGGFVLMESFSVDELPQCFRDAVRGRVAKLSQDALTLAGILALAGSRVLRIEECIELEEHNDASRTYRALAELQRLQLAALEDEGLRLARDYEDVLIAALPAACVQRLHVRLARLFVREIRDCVRAAKHYFVAGEEHAAIDALLRYAHDDTAVRSWFSENKQIFEQGIEASTRLRRRARDTFDLRRILTRALTLYVEVADRAQLAAFADELYELAGAGYLEQSSETDPQLRLKYALERALERHNELPEHERVVTPFEAISLLGTYIAGLSTYASYTHDVDLLWRIPSLLPFAPLSPSLLLMEKVVIAVRDIRGDRSHAGIAALRENIVALDAPDRAGFSEVLRDSTRAHMQNGLGTLEAAIGWESAAERASLIESLPDHRVNAWRIRYLIHLYRPDAQQAEFCRRQFERMLLQEGSSQYADGALQENELLVFALSDDLLALTRLKPQLAERAATFSGWLPWLHYAEAELERLRHRADRAVDLYGKTLALTAPGKHVAWTYAAAHQLLALIDAGRAAEAVELGRERIALAQARDLSSWTLIAGNLALAEAAVGLVEQARERVARATAAIEAREIRGVYYGVFLEASARVAIDYGDIEAFAQFFDRCWEQYGSGAYPPLASRLEKLMTAARRRNLTGKETHPTIKSIVPSVRIHDELASLTNPSERSARALSILVEATGASAGHLYGVDETDFTLMASLNTAAPSSALAARVQRFLHAQSSEERTLDFDELASMSSSAETTDGGEVDGLQYHLMLLENGTGEAAAGIVALGLPSGELRRPSQGTIAAIADALLAKHDVTGLTLMGER
ncbi:MAG TPA: serine/threonine-protein kinase [Polyangiales bacterium]|nr:serine/threonine-protein kinase [Polyangiales bacterium]